MKRILTINIGDRFDDLECVDIRKEPGKSTEYLMRCVHCGREKWMLSSTVRRKCGTTHKACGRGLKTKCPAFYDRWQAMRTRTNNPNYQHYDCYGGRGISSDAFKYFIDFYDAMYPSFRRLADEIGEENTSLERIDCNEDYTPENCTWIDKHLQQGNQRRTVRFKVIFPDGRIEEHKNARRFAVEHGLNPETVNDCLNGRSKTARGHKFIRLS